MDGDVGVITYKQYSQAKRCWLYKAWEGEYIKSHLEYLSVIKPQIQF